MSLIYIISDIHGNIDALKAFFKKARPKKKDLIYALGDYVGYYYWPNECLDLLKKKKVICIKGNHDNNYLKAKKNKNLFDLFAKKYGNAYLELDKKLSNKHLSFIQNMKTNLSVNFKSYRIKFSHGSPWKNDEYIYPDFKKKDLKKFLNYKEDIFFVGHTHRKMKKIIKNKIIYNPGSIGQPRDFYGAANWIVFDVQKKLVKFCSTKYSYDKIVKQIHLKDFKKFEKLKKYIK